MSIFIKKHIPTSDQDTAHFKELEPFSVKEATDYIVNALENRQRRIIQADIDRIFKILEVDKVVIPFNLNKVVSIILNSYQPIGTILETIKQRSKEWLQIEFYDGFMGNAVSAKILEYFPYFDPDSIDLSLLAVVIDQDEDAKWNEALQALEKNLLIKINVDNRELSVHRLLQNELSEYFKLKLTVDKKEEILKRLTEVVEAKIENEDLDSCNFKNVPYTHADRLIKTDWFNKSPDCEIKARLFQKMGIFCCQIQYRLPKSSLLQETGLIPTKIDFSKTLVYMNKALEMRERLFIGDHQELASTS